MQHLEPYFAEQFLQSFKQGEERGFDFFFRAYYKSLCFFANKYTRDMPAAEDVVSEVFMKVWERRESIESAAGLKSYLYRSVLNGCMRWKENGGRRKKVEVETKVEAKVEESYLENMIRAEVMQEVYNAIELLPKECKKIFTKIFIEGKSVKEIAEELKLSVSTVKTQKTRAINFLRSRLSPMSVVIIFTFFC